MNLYENEPEDDQTPLSQIVFQVFGYVLTLTIITAIAYFSYPVLEYLLKG